MIEFKGEFSSVCVEFMVLKHKIILANLAWVITAIFAIVLYFIANDSWEVYLFLTIPLTMVICAYCYPDKKHLESIIPEKVVIEDDIIEIIFYDDKYYDRNTIDDVKRVIDLGDLYFIDFYGRSKSEAAACPKALISKGSIEQFEELFADRIVRDDKFYNSIWKLACKRQK